MKASFVEKLQVAVITATLVSAGWIVAGAFLLDEQEAEQLERELREAQAQAVEQAQTPTPTPEETIAATKGAPAQDSTQISTPDAAQTSQLMIPVLDVSATDLTDNFSDERGGGSNLHEAIDIMAPAGTSVVAAAAGTIERLFRSDAGGNTIYIRSEDRETIYYYAHLAAYAPSLREGQRIRRGQRIGTVGSSGNASPEAPHLHFAVMRTTSEAEWWEPATALNPYPMLARRRP